MRRKCLAHVHCGTNAPRAETRGLGRKRKKNGRERGSMAGREAVSKTGRTRRARWRIVPTILLVTSKSGSRFVWVADPAIGVTLAFLDVRCSRIKIGDFGLDSTCPFQLNGMASWNCCAAYVKISSVIRPERRFELCAVQIRLTITQLNS